MSTEKPKIDISKFAAIQQAATEQANREVAPGALKAVYTEGLDIKVGPFTVRPVVSWDFVILRDINSFLYRQQLGEVVEMDKVPIEQICELCFLLTTPIREARSVLRKGRDSFAEAAVGKFENDIIVLTDIVKACTEQFKVALSTMQSHGPKDEKESVQAGGPFPPSSAPVVELKMA